MKKRILAVVAAIGILAGCYGPATGEVSPSGNVYTSHHSKQYQIDAWLASDNPGYLYVGIAWMCHGDTTWRYTPGKDVRTTTSTDGDNIDTQVYCPAGIATAHPYP